MRVRRLLLRPVARRAFSSKEGVTAIEYALIAGITVLAIVAGSTAIGTNLFGIFSNLGSKIPG